MVAILINILTGVVVVAAAALHAWAGSQGLILLMLTFCMFAIYEFGRYGDIVLDDRSSEEIWRRIWVAGLAIVVSTMVAVGLMGSLFSLAVALTSGFGLVVLRELDCRTNSKLIRRQLQGWRHTEQPKGFYRQLVEPLTGISLGISFLAMISLSGESSFPLLVFKVGVLSVSLPAFGLSLWLWRRRRKGCYRWLRPASVLAAYSLIAGPVAAFVTALRVLASQGS